MNSYIYPTPLGEITLIEDNGFLTRLLFPGNTIKIECSYQKSDLLNRAKCSIARIFQRRKNDF